MAAPCVLFASCSDTPPEELVKLVLEVENLPVGTDLVEDIISYDWKIENKYYSSEVKLCTTNSRTIGDKQFADSVQAFVIHFDSKQLSSFDQMKSWLPYLKALEPDVLMLVCDTCSSGDAVDRLTAQKFCIDHSFELVELNPDDTTSDEEEEDDFKETTGIKRVIQALHAHTWPNLVMKDKPDVRSTYFRQLMQEELDAKTRQNSSFVDEDDHFQDFVSCEMNVNSISHCMENESQSSPNSGASDINHADLGASSSSSSNSTNIPVVSSLIKEGLKNKDCQNDKKEDTQKISSEDTINSLLGNDDLSMLASLGADDADPETESFEQLFEKLRVMKEKAETLPPEDRKVYAEKIAVSFWKAIGGDEAEIDGLDDSD